MVPPSQSLPTVAIILEVKGGARELPLFHERKSWVGVQVPLAVGEWPDGVCQVQTVVSCRLSLYSVALACFCRIFRNVP